MPHQDSDRDGPLEIFVEAELRAALPADYALAATADGWQLNRVPVDDLDVGFAVIVSREPPMVTITHGNSDGGPFGIHHLAQRSTTIRVDHWPAPIALAIRLRDVLAAVFAREPPNRWGYS